MNQLAHIDRDGLVAVVPGVIFSGTPSQIVNLPTDICFCRLPVCADALASALVCTGRRVARDRGGHRCVATRNRERWRGRFSTLYRMRVAIRMASASWSMAG
jgi:hypothetical protein